MKDLEEKIVETIEVILPYVGETKDFVLEQAPLVVQEIYVYHLFYHGFWALFSVLFFVVCFLFARLTQRIYKRIGKTFGETNTEEDNEILTPACAAAFSFVLGMIFFSSNIFTVAQIFLAPRLYLLEYLQKLVK